MLQKVVGEFANVQVLPFTGLTVHFVRSVGAHILLRGIRTTSDMEYEFTMSLTNRALDPEIETVFLMAGDSTRTSAAACSARSPPWAASWISSSRR